MKRSVLFIASIGLAACASQQALNAEPDQSAKPIKAAEQCTAYGGSNWQAQLINSEKDDGLMLKVSGVVTLPSPGYTVEWHTGPMDRMRPPGLRLRLTTQAPPPGQINIQVLTDQEVAYEMASPVPEYRSVTVLCGGSVLAEMNNVKLAD